MKHLLLAATLLVPTLASAQAPVWLSNPAGQPYGAGNPLPTAPGMLSYTSGATTTVTTGGTAVTAAAAGAIHTGFDIKNPAAATEPLYFNLAGTAGTTESGTTFALAAGASYHGTGGTAQALSVNAATSGHVFALQVY